MIVYRFPLIAVGFISAYAAFCGSVATLSAQTPTAVTIDGRVIQCSLKQKPPWENDVLKQQWPEYPYEARSRHWEGTGMFQMHLRPDGTVESVKILKSVGYSMLDQSAIAGLLKWRFKAGKWKAIDTPIWFSSHPPPQPGYRAGQALDRGMRSR